MSRDADCQRCREELAALRRGEETAIPEPELRAHLASCADCRATEAETAALEELLQANQPALAADSLAGLRLAIAGDSPIPHLPAGRSRAIPVPLAAAAAAAAFLIALVVSAQIFGRRDRTGSAPAAMVGVITQAEGETGFFAGKLAGPARAGMELSLGQQLGTGPGSRVSLVTSRGTRIDLGERSRLLIAAAGSVTLEAGRLLAAVEKGSAAFRVRTADAEIETLGTRFTAEASGGLTRVTVIDGQVRFRRAQGAAAGVLVGVGQTSVVAAGSEPSAPTAAGPEALVWLLAAPAPRLEMELVPAKARIPAGQRLTAQLRVVNRSEHAVSLDGPGRPMPAYFLRLTDPAGQTSYVYPAVLAARVNGEPVSAAAFTLPPGAGYELDLDLGGLMEAPGEYRVAVVYFGTLRSPTGTWSGALESRMGTVQVEPRPGKSGGQGSRREPGGS